MLQKICDVGKKIIMAEVQKRILTQFQATFDEKLRVCC